MTVKFKQISATFEQTPDGRGNIHLFALDENGQLWEKLRDIWSKVAHPDEEVESKIV
jgi:hypothetical protein